MADLAPLEYDTSGLDQFKTATRGVGAAQGVSDELALQRSIAAARARAAAARAASAATAPGAASAAAAPSITPAASAAVGENAAPLATAAAEAVPSFGRVLLRGLGRLSLPITAGLTAFDAAKLFTPAPLAVRMASAVGTLGKALGIDNGYAGGTAQYDAASALPAVTPITAADHQQAAASAAPAPQAPVPVTSSRTGDNVSVTDGSTGNPPNANPSSDIVSVYDPASGEFRQMGRAAYEARVADARARAMDPEYQAERAKYNAGTVTPSLQRDDGFGSGPSVFRDLVNFTNGIGPTMLSAATANRGAKLGIENAKLSTLAAKQQADSQAAQGRYLLGYASMLKALQAGQNAGVKVVQDAAGNPVVVNTSNPSNPTARKVTPTSKPTQQEFIDAARKDSRNAQFTDEQLKAYYQKQYGG